MISRHIYITKWPVVGLDSFVSLWELPEGLYADELGSESHPACSNMKNDVSVAAEEQ